VDEIRATMVALRTDLQQATLRIEEQAKHLGEVDQVRRLLERKHNTAHITPVLGSNRTLCTQHNRALIARIEGKNRQLVELGQVREAFETKHNT
jgi:hypothetical protein